MSLLFLLASAASAVPKVGTALVVGGSVVVGLGPIETGNRVGLSFDGGYQLQRWNEESAPTSTELLTVWAEESLQPNYGPVVHVWRNEGAWAASAGARLGATWPLRMGLNGEWRPGPGAAAEVALVMRTSGEVGLDLQAVLEGPYVQARVGAAVHPQGLFAPRFAVGGFEVFGRPENWPESRGDVWDPERTPTTTRGPGR